MALALLPPGPGLPAVVQGAMLARRPFRFLERFRDAHGEAFTIATPPLGRTPIFARPDYIERIFELDGVALRGGDAQAPVVAFAGDRSLMKLDGRDHREHRSLLTSLLRPADLPGGGAGVLDRARTAVVAWPVGRPFDLGEAIDRLALDLVADIVLGESPEALVALAVESMRSLRLASRPFGLLRVALLGSRGLGPFRQIRQATEAYLDDRATRRTGTGSCLFDRLAAGGSGRGSLPGAADLRDETMTLLAAMLGGLACGTRHAFDQILRAPEVQARVRDSLGAEPGAIAKAPYLDATCKEILRLCPDIPFAVRKATTDVAIGPWRIPAGTTLGIGIYLIQRREASFPDPDSFRPERFLTARPSRFEYLPFGGGRRGCVAGPLFVFLEKMILAAAFERFRFRLCDRRENPITSFGLVSTPSRPIRVVAEPVATRPRRSPIRPPESRRLPVLLEASDAGGRLGCPVHRPR